MKFELHGHSYRDAISILASEDEALLAAFTEHSFYELA